ncbi:MAG: discoidin domain-containing protein, partial [Thermoleophilia bacterium]|nr:discoidin domain-containing protein [Thermoleophilia bacterium]
MGDSGYTRCRQCQAINEPGSLFCSRCGASLTASGWGEAGGRRRRVTARGAALSTILFLLLVAAVFTLGSLVYRTLRSTEDVTAVAGLSGTLASTSTTATSTSDSGAAQGGTSASTGNPGTTVAAVLVRPKAVSASSTLPATSTNSYRATNLVDGDLATAWNEGAPGPGSGEWVRFEFSQALTLVRLEVANGYQKDNQRFKGNARVKTIKLEYSTGNTQLVDLLDTKDFQTIKTLDKPTKWLKL